MSKLFIPLNRWN
ncbi:protein tdcF, partial [Vibrio harveyi]